MARRRGRKWQADVREGTTRHRPTFNTKHEAEAWEEDARRCISRGLPIPLPHSTVPTLGAYVERCLSVVWGNVKARDTKVSMTGVIARHFGPARPLDTITIKDINDFIDTLRRKGRSTTTLNEYIGIINRILNEAHEEGCPFPGGTPPRVKRIPHKPGGRIREISEAELATLVRHFTETFNQRHQALLILFLRWTGCRRGEALDLRWEDITGNRITFWETKNGESRSIPILPPVAEVLRELRTAGVSRPFERVQVHSFVHYWKQARGLMNLQSDPEFVVHALRHTSCSHQVRQGVPLMHVQRWHGHKDIKMTMRYAHLAPEDLEGVADKLGMSVPKSVSSV